MKPTQLFNFVFRYVAPVIVLAGAGFFVYAMGSRPKVERKKLPVRQSIPVEIVRAENHTGPLDIDVSGVAIPFREVVVSSRVGGEVVFKADVLSPGNYVEKDQLLLRVDPTDYDLQVSNYKQELEQTRVELKRLEIDRANTERLLKLHREIVALRQNELDRIQQLGRASATSKSNVEASQLALLTAREEVTNQENTLRRFDTDKTSLENAVSLAELRLEKAQIDLQRTEVRAPFAGVVIANHVEQNGHVAGGGPVATLEDTSAVEVRCNLRSEDMPFVLSTPHDVAAAAEEERVEKRVVNRGEHLVSTSAAAVSQQGMAYRLPPVPVTIEYERSGHVCRWDGVLSRLDGLGVDEATRTVPVRIRVSNPVTQAETTTSGRTIPLARGMFVSVRIHCRPTIPIAVIPESVLRPGKSVWLMHEGRLQMQPVEIAAIAGGRAFIDLTHTPDLASTSIISSPVPNVRNGLPISLMKANKKGEPGKTITNVTTTGGVMSDQDRALVSSSLESMSSQTVSKQEASVVREAAKR